MKTATTLYFELTELIGHETKLNQKDCIALIESYAKEHVKEILDELISMQEYMKEKNAFHGYGQMKDLITKLEEWINPLKQRQ